MRHRVVGKKLGRDTSHRKALLKNLSGSLIISESVTTTLAKAKYLRPYVEKLITGAKKSTGFSSRRLIMADLNDGDASRKLFFDLARRFSKRPGGYTRITKLSSRDGDNAQMARIEFVDAKAEELQKKSTKKAGAKVESEEKVLSQPAPEKVDLAEAPAPKISRQNRIVKRAPHTGVRKKG
ncbi:MAG: 50S ribosomal protein L17 [Patescibacteria group bacterium]|jgi:large subunit ribosomal protein L17